MNSKFIYTIFIIALFAGIFIIFPRVASAKCLNLSCFQKQNMTVTLKDNADIDTSKNIISKTLKVKIIKVTDRNKEWSKMVNRMDLPKMENPFKNEFIIQMNKNANINEIYDKIKGMEFVENVEYISDKASSGKSK